MYALECIQRVDPQNFDQAVKQWLTLIVAITVARPTDHVAELTGQIVSCQVVGACETIQPVDRARSVDQYARR